MKSLLRMPKGTGPNAIYWLDMKIITGV